ncbi:MAG: VanZ family protein [Candidatus Gastranaerophilales bacterium]|nr:VanZ family protein [Candidatus Gastranaerophilales bacterium]
MKGKLYLFFSGIWLGIIFFYSLQTPETQGNLDNVSNNFNSIISFLKIKIEYKTFRELLNIGGHLFEFFFLSVFLYGYFKSLKLHYPRFIALAVALFCGLIDECIQGFVSGRVSSVSDVFVDLVGAGLGIVATYIKDSISNKKFNFIVQFYS